ncbi:MULTISPECIES: hypothetical protein [Streptomyces violaceoruber group]|uniref:hypothetical protein n=1 Tax=Streptomyces violaceoruber group TaxID=2867121 RepID=UPI002E36EFD0|nr:hypothetical protein [Streptomyces anthocyanicus]
MTLDDNAVVTASAMQSLARGPGWGRVRSWDVLVDSVTAMGPGSVAFVLARRQGPLLGHAWAAYHLGGSEGVVWVDVSAGAGLALSSGTPALAPMSARAVLVDPTGRVVEDALPGFAESASTEHALIDAATGRDYGAIGLELEYHRVFFVKNPAIEGHQGGELLARGPGLRIVTDSYPFWQDAGGRLYLNRPEVPPGQRPPAYSPQPVGEIVTRPMAVLPQERETRWSQRQILAQLDRIGEMLNGVDARQTPTPLTALLSDLDGWSPTGAGRSVDVYPAPVDGGRSAYVHITSGTASVGLRELQDLAFDGLTISNVKSLIFSGRLFGEQAVLRFAGEVTGRTDLPSSLVPFLSAVPEMDEVWGYSWLAYQHLAAGPAVMALWSSSGRKHLAKNFLMTALRGPFSHARLALRPRVRDFLAGNYHQLSEDARRRLTPELDKLWNGAGKKHPYSRQYFDEIGALSNRPREMATFLFTGATPQGERVSQFKLVGMKDYEQLDSGSGSLTVPLILPEIRHFGYGDRRMNKTQVKRAVKDFTRLGRQTYNRASTYRLPLSERALQSSVSAIVDDWVVQSVAGFLEIASAWRPRLPSRTRPLMDAGETQAVAHALALRALGRESSDSYDAYAVLERAAEEALGLLGRVPLQDRVRTAIESARAALRALHAPDSLPPLLEWPQEITALDGAPVPVDQVSLVRHPDAQGQPAGVSSRPAQDWSDPRRRAYAQLAETHWFTEVSRGPVPREGKLQQLPFGASYAIGLLGDSTGMALSLTDGSSVFVDHATVVDFLFATDSHLTALPLDVALLFPTADLTGRPRHDPLVHPVVGQVLANGLGRWVWSTAGGGEAFPAGGAHERHLRLQLTEGDWLAGFRPEPTAAELERLAVAVTGDRGRARDVLHWVRAIRLIYGPMLEDNETAFFTLLRGFWAVEQSRAPAAGPLSWRDLQGLVGQYLDSARVPRRGLSTDLPFLLTGAASSAGMALNLHEFDLTPHHHSPRAWDPCQRAGW